MGGGGAQRADQKGVPWASIDAPSRPGRVDNLQMTSRLMVNSGGDSGRRGGGERGWEDGWVGRWVLGEGQG